MLRRFFEMLIDENGTLVEEAYTKRRQLFHNPKLAIANDESFIKHHLGKYPVIYISFHDVAGSNEDEIIDYMMQKVTAAFQRYSWLAPPATTSTTSTTFSYRFGKIVMDALENNFTSNENTTPEDQQDYLFEKVLRRGASNEEIMEAIPVLTRLIRKFYNKPLMVFVDAFDAPLMYSLDNHMYSNEILFYTDYVLHWFCYSRVNVERGLINGVSQLLRASKSILSANLPYYSFSEDHPFAYDFLFTTEQVDQLMSKKPDQQLRLDVQQRYDGYKITNKLIAGYNVYDIVQYTAHGTLRDYWSERQLVQVLKPGLKYKIVMEKLIQLLLTNKTQFAAIVNVRLDDLTPFLRLMEGDHTLKGEKHFDLYFSHFVEHGYLTRTVEPNVYALPNAEIGRMFRNDFLNFVHQTYDIQLANNTEIASALHSIVTHNQTTDATLEQLANAVNDLLGMDRYRLDYFELQGIVIGALYYNSNVSGEIVPLREKKEINMPFFYTIKQDIIQIASDDGKTLVIIRVSFRHRTPIAVEKLHNYVPLERRNTSRFTVVKYIVLNTNWDDQFEAIKLRNRYSW